MPSGRLCAASRYKEIVPTALTPAATVNGELVWDSMDILNRLEREFTERPLLPAEPELQDEAGEIMAEAEALGGAGFKCAPLPVLRGGAAQTPAQKVLPFVWHSAWEFYGEGSMLQRQQLHAPPAES